MSKSLHHRPGLVLLAASLLSLAVAGYGCDDEATPEPTSPPPGLTPSPASTPTPTPTPPPPSFWPGSELSIPSELEPLFSLTTVPAFHVHLTEAEWNGLLHDFDENPRNEIYRQADLTAELEGQAPLNLTSVGFRLRGNTWSRVRPEDGEAGTPHDPSNSLVRAHFKLKFNEQFDQDESVYGPPSMDVPTVPENKGRELLPGVKSLNFKFNNGDPTYLREVMSYDLFRRSGVQAPLAAYARLYISIGAEAERYMGVFILLENLDEEWIKRRYGSNSVLFKCLYQGEGPADLDRVDLDDQSDAGAIGIEKTDPADALEAASWDSDSSPYRPAYDLKTQRDDFLAAQDHLNDLIALVRSSPSQVQLEAALDVESLLMAYAVNVYVGMSDDYWRLANNYYLLLRPEDSRWMFIPYDYDRTFGIATVGEPEATSSLIAWGSSRVVSTTHLMDVVLAVPALMDRWRSLLTEMHSADEDLFRKEPLLLQAERQEALIGPWTSSYEALDAYPYTDDLSEVSDFIDARLEVAEEEVP